MKSDDIKREIERGNTVLTKAVADCMVRVVISSLKESIETFNSDTIREPYKPKRKIKFVSGKEYQKRNAGTP